MWSKDFGTAEISFLIISAGWQNVKEIFWIFSKNFGDTGLGVFSMRIWRKCVLFYLGGCAYLTLELLWRGWSHGSMFLAGGTCFLLIGHLEEVDRPLPLPIRMVVGAGIVTAVELGAGLLVNRDYRVWDYRNQPGNFLGQICPVYSLLWLPVSLLAIGLYHFFSGKLDRKAAGRDG